MMTSPLTLAVVSAGLSQPSSTRLLADRLAQAAARRIGSADAGHRDVEIRDLELRDLANDIAHALVTGFPGARLREAVEAMTGADGLIAVTPIFNASYSGLFKSFFDLVDNTALTGIPTLIAATGGSTRHSLALDHALRPLFAYLHADTVPTAVYAASEDWGSSSGSVTANGSGNGSGASVNVSTRTGGAANQDELSSRIERAAGELANRILGRVLGRGPAPRPRPHSAAEDDFSEVVPFAEQLAALKPDTP
jgi:FMN reductase